jgi:hypothetical protein
MFVGCGVQPTFCSHFSMLFCELIYRCTSSGSPTIIFPLYILPPFDDALTGAVLLLFGTPGLGLTGVGLIVGERRGDGEKGTEDLCTAPGRLPPPGKGVGVGGEAVAK